MIGLPFYKSTQRRTSFPIFLLSLIEAQNRMKYRDELLHLEGLSLAETFEYPNNILLTDLFNH